MIVVVYLVVEVTRMVGIVVVVVARVFGLVLGGFVGLPVQSGRTEVVVADS